MTHSINTSFNSIQVKNVFEGYPNAFANKLLFLRELILEVAAEMGVDGLEETLKWGEPSYLTKNGSTVRLAWRSAKPKQYGMFFNCKTTLIDTFKEVYCDDFTFESNRAIVFEINDEVPVQALKHCIELSLRYKSIKHLPLLGL